MLQRKLRRLGTAVLSLGFLFVVSSIESYAQTFTSGSTGSDGALNLTTPGTIIFDPKSFSPPLDPDADNVYHFSTINIASGVTVKLTNKIFSGPVYWLAQGNVTINGTIDLNGEDGHVSTALSSLRVPAASGAGGFNGGVGGSGFAGRPGPQPGSGPGGAIAPGTANNGGFAGNFSGSQYLIPLIGGSGGAGGFSQIGNTVFAGGGGGGGGAILIASSTSITLTSGKIFADGGSGGLNTGSHGGGSGSGGAIRLVAPVINGDGGSNLFARGGANSPAGGPGIVRVESFSGNVTNVSKAGTFITSTPLSAGISGTPPSAVKVISLVSGGVTIPINANPFSFPDAIINTAVPVTVNVQAQFIPLGTIPKIIIMSETGVDQTVNCSALVGTLQQSTCSANITFPTGGSRGFVRATWQ